jgi:hypothetical protein
MLYVYNTRGMNIWVVRPFIRPQLRNHGTEAVKWGNALRVVLRVRFSEHGSNIWMNLLPDYKFYRKLLVLPYIIDLITICNIYSKQLCIWLHIYHYFICLCSTGQALCLNSGGAGYEFRYLQRLL